MYRKHDHMASYSVKFCFEMFFERRYDKTRRGELLREIKHDINRRLEIYCSDAVLRITGLNSYTDTYNDFRIQSLKMQTISSVLKWIWQFEEVAVCQKMMKVVVDQNNYMEGSGSATIK